MTISLERETYEVGDVIIRQGNVGDNFYIIAEGDVGVYRCEPGGQEMKLTVLHQGDYFGEKALLKEDVRQASCIAETKVTCLTLGRDDFIEMLGSLDDMMKNTHKNDNLPAFPSHEEKSTLLDIQLNDLEVTATLGCGGFGRVKLTRYPKTGQYFALKCQAKKSIVEIGLTEHVLNEMRVMKTINNHNPHIAKLYAALQDNCNIYFVLELLQGGELFTHLRDRGKLSEQDGRFYAATVVSAFATLHAKKIAYRDLKPENLVSQSLRSFAVFVLFTWCCFFLV
jgi:hypothetical protein